MALGDARQRHHQRAQVQEQGARERRPDHRGGGGLIRDTKLTGENRVPFLGRIPILGNLFKVRNAKRAKTNLMVFIRPTILRDAVQVNAATKDNYDIIRDAQGKQKGNSIGDLPIMPFDKPPLLPEMQPAPQLHPRAPRLRPRPRFRERRRATLESNGRSLPFTFARRHGIVLGELRDGVAHCALRRDANASAVAETRRLLRPAAGAGSRIGRGIRALAAGGL